MDKGPDTPLIALGAEVMGSDGKLGEVSRVVVDADIDQITDIVVKQGFVLPEERLLPIDLVRDADMDMVHVEINSEQFQQLDGFNPEDFRAPDPDYSGPPGFDTRSRGRANMQLDTVVAIGATSAYGTSAPIGGFPGGEHTRHPNIVRPDIREGSDVIAADGEKVGEVAELVVNADSGQPDRLVLKQGFLFPSESELPVDWIDDLTDKGVVLNRSHQEVEAHARR